MRWQLNRTNVISLRDTIITFIATLFASLSHRTIYDLITIAAAVALKPTPFSLFRAQEWKPRREPINSSSTTGNCWTTSPLWWPIFRMERRPPANTNNPRRTSLCPRWKRETLPDRCSRPLESVYFANRLDLQIKQTSMLLLNRREC